MKNSSGAPRLPAGGLILFALGQMGWSLASFAVTNLLTYFYMPPESAEGTSFFPSFIPQQALFLSLTVIGILNFGSRIFDAVTDPWVAFLSDRNSSRFGKRLSFMGLSALPLAIFSFLIFFPPTAHHEFFNTVYLALMLFLFYLSFTFYVTPYNALIAELGQDSKQRLNIATMVSVTWALGFALGNQVHALQALIQIRVSLPPLESFQYALAALAGLSLCLMLLPVIFIDEARYTQTFHSSEKLLESLKKTLADKSFRFFLISDLFYWMGLTFIQLGMSYYVIVLLELPAESISFYMLVLFGLSFVFYLPVNLLAQHLGKKRLLLLAFVLLAGVFFLASQLRADTFLSSRALAFILVSVASLPLAIFGILPNAMIADFSQHSAEQSGVSRHAMYFGSRTFAMKLGISLTNLIFPTLLLWGKGIGNDDGVRLSAWVALFICLLGALVFWHVQETPGKSHPKS